MRLRADQLTGHLKRNSLAPLYLVCGDEPLQMIESIDSIRATARANGFEERVVLEVDKQFDWNRLLHESASLSLFSSKKIMELRLGDLKPGREGGPALIEYASQASPDNLLIISSARLDKRTLSAKWCQAIDKAGVIMQIWPVTAAELPDWISQRCKNLGKRIDRQGAELIAQRVEGNLMAASQEINKLCLLADGDNITLDVVAAAVVDSSRYDVFAMMEAAFSGDIARSARMLQGFRGEGVEPMAIYGALMWNMRLLSSLALRVAAGDNVDQALASQWGLNAQKKFALKKALNRHQPEFIQQLLVNAGKLDRILKGENKPLGWSCFQELLQAIVDHRAWPPQLLNALTA